MLTFNDKQKKLLIAGGILIFFVLHGCSGNLTGKSEDGKKIVAKINNYELTIEDFKNEADIALVRRYLSPDPLKVKEAILEDLITKKVLLQEAQGQGLDKDKAFMKEIERYWEQTLLKQLIQKKLNELSRNISVKNNEIMKQYVRMNRKIHAEIVILKNKASANKLAKAKDDFDDVKDNLGDNVISDEPANWWSFGDLPLILEDAIAMLKPGQLSPAIKLGDNWAVIRVLGEEKVDVEPFEKIAPKIQKNILERKTSKMLEVWIMDLKKKATIDINKEVLNEIKID